jgi:hypothetical protein
MLIYMYKYAFKNTFVKCYKEKGSVAYSVALMPIIRPAAGKRRASRLWNSRRDGFQTRPYSAAVPRFFLPDKPARINLGVQNQSLSEKMGKNSAVV